MRGSRRGRKRIHRNAPRRARLHHGLFPRRHLHKTIEDHPLTFPLSTLAPALALPDVDETLVDLAFEETDTPKTPLELLANG